MTCSAKRPVGWLVAAPVFPFLIAAWAGGAARRKRGSGTRSHCDRARRHRKGAPDRSRAEDRRPTSDIVDTAAAAGRFRTLLDTVEAAGLVDNLRGDGPWTVFAPTDDAFDRLPDGALAELLADREKLASVLTLHVVPGRIEAGSLSTYAAIKTVQGGSLAVDTSMGVKVGSAYVVQADIETSNGLIHAIDDVLLPE